MKIDNNIILVIGNTQMSVVVSNRAKFSLINPDKISLYLHYV